MSMRGRRPEAGTERTPSGAISRSKANIAKRAEKLREQQKEAVRREAKHGRSLQERTQRARAAYYKIPAQHAASHHASTLEGRMYLKGIITSHELLALERYRRTLDRFGRETGRVVISVNPLSRYLPSEPRGLVAPPSGAAGALAKRDYDRAEDALDACGMVGKTKVSWAVSRVMRHATDLEGEQLLAFLEGVKALVGVYRLGTDPDRNAQAA